MKEEHSIYHTIGITPRHTTDFNKSFEQSLFRTFCTRTLLATTVMSRRDAFI